MAGQLSGSYLVTRNGENRNW